MGAPPLAVVVPALNAAASLPAALASLETGRRSGLVGTVLVSDGGSQDETRAVAVAAGARVLEGPPGRGGQIARGVAATAEPWLLVLHADTRLEPGWEAEAADFLRRPDANDLAAAFRFALDDDAPAAGRLERAVAWRVRRLGLPYGDQGLLVSRARLEAAGGFRDLPLMEDVDVIRRLGRGRIVPLASVATTSAARFRRNGYLRRSARNLLCLTLFLAGVPAAGVRRLYG